MGMSAVHEDATQKGRTKGAVKEVRVEDPVQDEEGANPSSAPSAPEGILAKKRNSKRHKVKRQRNQGPRSPVTETSLVVPLTSRKPPEEAPGGMPLLGGANYHRWLEEQKLGALMQKLSEGTRLGYESAWRQWVAYRTLQEKCPLLKAETGTRGGRTRRT